MSRIGKKVITLPEKTELKVSGGSVFVKGPLGELSRVLHKNIEVKINGNEVTLHPTKENIETRALWGTYASHISNMISGVNKVFEKKLILEGIGFKSEVKLDKIVLSLGFSHPVEVLIPNDLKVTAEKNVITISGRDKEQVGQFSARLRSLKKPEPYKGKGMRYDNEVIRRKQGKKSV
ncbi:MAG: 50S ribosomal protein L6 [Parcubacteria group bacterium GW2011_GWB1_38_8]|uniref:50S ribosomal protein L6 n=1 Tax=Candidatus Zambryskibacteria bacterium RIFCSPLOWO2_02_FULL_39_14 TaxID=1802769 RepID=A0A1G2UIS1_9BACT|nr:MAG: 50S ribosomal protein L6 [Parcubacteria group bacterium GW2011_GWB1_38_8]KKR30890.1 MAG: 50S ribosomal protein L6 [Parcubacteria group bacterium GW2011_GWC1_39_8]OHA94772.1 MAG: 50S ribosomal protein L6 [Candidatus Zambryskibacteria bacterium RIFCSPHIGHO2_02_FULL_39_16]OHB09339.1 MAG: 50S ribosomal protein L6 [Candidatus Zambryskibacteria bacterium RIFCSPLOWO2_02_FULL_39_14]